MSGEPASSSSGRLGRWLFWAGLALLILLLAAVCLWALMAPGTDAYKVNGMPFRQWVARQPESDIQDALAPLGTNVVPHLTAILRRPPESLRTYQWKLAVWNRLPQTIKSHFPQWQPVSDIQVRRTALFGIRYFGTEARSAMPEVVRMARTETNLMLRAGALVAALHLAPQAPKTFALWRDEWVHTNHFSRHDLAIYVHSPHVPIPAAVPYLLAEAQTARSPDVVSVLEAFEYFGEAARPAVPYMVREFTEGSTFRGNMVLLFARLGPVASEAVPALAACLQEEGPAMVTAYDGMQNAQVTSDARPGLNASSLRALGAIGPTAQPALPVIASFLTNKDSTIRMLAAAALARVGGHMELAMPALLAGLQGDLPKGSKTSVLLFTSYPEPLSTTLTSGASAAAVLCGELGPGAAEALTLLEERLQEKNPWVRVAAAQAIWRISGKADKSLPALVAALDSIPKPDPSHGRRADEYLLVFCAEAIGEMGPAGQPAIPSLERVRTFSLNAHHAVDRALSRIQAPPQK